MADDIVIINGVPFIRSWEISQTGQCRTEGLHGLRDDTPKVIARVLFLEGPFGTKNSLLELMFHGCMRKAAEVTRELVAIDATKQQGYM